MPMIKVESAWGMPVADQESVEYQFETQAEMDAFLLGVDEGVGWLDYKILGDENERGRPE